MDELGHHDRITFNHGRVFMIDDKNDNIFDEDDALDYIMCEECEKDVRPPR